MHTILLLKAKRWQTAAVRILFWIQNKKNHSSEFVLPLEKGKLEWNFPTFQVGKIIVWWVFHSCIYVATTQAAVGLDKLRFSMFFGLLFFLKSNQKPKIFDNFAVFKSTLLFQFHGSDLWNSFFFLSVKDENRQFRSKFQRLQPFYVRIETDKMKRKIVECEFSWFSFWIMIGEWSIFL